MMQYTDLVGYLNFSDLPENALAMLQLAEEYQDKTVWIDAFAHCVGMKDRLPDCSGWNVRCMSLSHCSILQLTHQSSSAGKAKP